MTEKQLWRLRLLLPDRALLLELADALAIRLAKDEVLDYGREDKQGGAREDDALGEVRRLRVLREDADDEDECEADLRHRDGNPGRAPLLGLLNAGLKVAMELEVGSVVLLAQVGAIGVDGHGIDARLLEEGEVVSVSLAPLTEDFDRILPSARFIVDEGVPTAPIADESLALMAHLVKPGLLLREVGECPFDGCARAHVSLPL